MQRSFVESLELPIIGRGSNIMTYALVNGIMANLGPAADFMPNRICQGQNVYGVEYSLNDCACYAKCYLQRTPFMVDNAWMRRYWIDGQAVQRTDGGSDATGLNGRILPYAVDYGGLIDGSLSSVNWLDPTDPTSETKENEILDMGGRIDGRDEQETTIWRDEFNAYVDAAEGQTPFYSCWWLALGYNVRGAYSGFTYWDPEDPSYINPVVKFPTKDCLEMDIYPILIPADVRKRNGVYYGYKGSTFRLARDAAKQMLIGKQSEPPPMPELRHAMLTQTNPYCQRFKYSQFLDTQMLLCIPKWNGV